jgi:predicted N-acetyltransferase YhbS
MTIVPLSTVPQAEIEALLDRAFGPDRHGRTAYRIRAGTHAIDALSFAMFDEGGALIGSIQCFPVELVGDDGVRTPMIMVGPIAIEPTIQRVGQGRALVRHMLAAAAGSGIAGSDALMLIGDPEYYTRFFGFSDDRTGGWRLPGPFEARRLLALGDKVPEDAGMVGPRVLADA